MKNRFALFVAAIVVAPVITPTPAEAYTVKVAVVGDVACGDVMPQALNGRDFLLEAYRNSDGSWQDDLNILEAVYTDLPDEEARSMGALYTALDQSAKDIVAELGGKGFVRFYVPYHDKWEKMGAARGNHSVQVCGWHPTLDAHEDLHILTDKPDTMHKEGYHNPETNERGLDTTSKSHPGANRVNLISETNMQDAREGFKRLATTNCPEGFFSDGQYPDFCFRVTITGADPIEGVHEAECIEDTVCVSGALPGRSEVYIRIMGPRPNGYLWPTIVRFTPSRVDVEMLQLSSGKKILYSLLPPRAKEFTSLSGVQHRTGFLPQD